MLHELFGSTIDFCTSFLFNNPEKIIDACFGHNYEASPIMNPCTGAVLGMIFGPLLDGFNNAGSPNYDNSGLAEPRKTDSGTVANPPEMDLSDFLPDEYNETREAPSLTLGDVVD